MSNKPHLHQSGRVSPSAILWTLGGSLFLAILLMFLFNTKQEATAGCNYPYPGDSGKITLSVGDSLCIPPGSIFTGTVSSFPAGSKITVYGEAIFRPSSVSSFDGTLINNGESLIPDAVLGQDFSLINNDTMSFEGTLSLSGTIGINNTENGRLTFVYPLNFNRSSTLQNDGIIYSGSNIVLADSSSTTNNGYFVGLGSFDFLGRLNNYGLISAAGVITLGGSSEMNNDCSIISIDGFVNDNPNTQNTGIIIVQGANGFPNDLIEINQPFNNQGQGYLAGVRFINNSTVSGGGNYYFSGQTENNGPFGDDGTGINFYDAGGPANIMDVENTSPDASVYRDAASIPDSFFIPPGCDVSFLPAFLPVEWQDISVSFEQGVSLVQWSTTSEVNHDHFEVERSLDGKKFNYLSQVKTPEQEVEGKKSYLYRDMDVQFNQNQTIYYRIRQVDIDGKSSLSQVLSLSTADTEVPLNFFVANPVLNGRLAITIASDQALDGTINIMDIQGKEVYNTPVSISRGRNSRGFSVKNLSGGMYVVELRAGGKKLSRKIILQSY